MSVTKITSIGKGLTRVKMALPTSEALSEKTYREEVNQWIS